MHQATSLNNPYPIGSRKPDDNCNELGVFSIFSVIKRVSGTKKPRKPPVFKNVPIKLYDKQQQWQKNIWIKLSSYVSCGIINKKDLINYFTLNFIRNPKWNIKDIPYRPDNIVTDLMVLEDEQLKIQKMSFKMTYDALKPRLAIFNKYAIPDAFFVCQDGDVSMAYQLLKAGTISPRLYRDAYNKIVDSRILDEILPDVETYLRKMMILFVF